MSVQLRELVGPECKVQTGKIVVVLTAYNEDKCICDVVRDFSSQEGVISTIVIDNNSHDETEQRATEAGALVIRENKQGYGHACIRALREGLNQEDADIIVLAEGDGSFIGADLNKLLPYLKNVDMVLGNRTSYGLVDDDSQQDWFMVWGNLFIAKLIQMKYWHSKFWGKCRLTDVGCTLRVIRREALKKIVDELYIGSHHFSPHMIMTALANDLSVVEVPVTFRKRVGQSKGAGGDKKLAILVGLSMIWHIITFKGKGK